MTTRTQAHSLLAFFLLSVPISGCSLIVDVLESDETDPMAAGDASSADGATGPDAAFAVCGPSLSNTLAYFAAESDEGRLAFHDSVSGTDLGESFRVENNEFTDVELAVVAGPTDCGNAFDLSQQDDRVLRVQHSRLAGVMSVDLWIRVAADPAAAVMVVIGKDLVQLHNGDLQLSVFNNGVDSHVVMRMQSLTPEPGLVYYCSPNIAREQWHHLALSFDGSDALLFVDGQTANSDVNISTYPGSPVCNQATGSSKTAMPSMNDNDWLIGASNSRSPNTTAEEFFVGSVDELRFRTSGFTQAEAEMVYGEGR